MEYIKEGDKSIVYDNDICKVTVFFKPEIKVWNGELFFSADVTRHPYAIVQLNSVDRTDALALDIIEADRQFSKHRWWQAIQAKLGFRESADKLRESVVKTIQAADSYKLAYFADQQAAKSVIDEAKRIGGAMKQLDNLGV